MGVSTDAILFYGYCWDEEGVDLFGDGEYEEEEEWDKRVAAKRGIVNPWSDYHEPDRRRFSYDESEAITKKWIHDHDEALDGWYVQCRAIRDEFACNIGTHCSNECRMYYVYVRASEVIASRGNPKVVHPRAMVAGVERDNYFGYLGVFTDELGIDLSEAKGPGWFLVSDWC